MGTLELRRSHAVEWPNEPDPSPNLVDVYVGYLRRKLEAPSGRRLIRTVRGTGFVLEPEQG